MSISYVETIDPLSSLQPRLIERYFQLIPHWNSHNYHDGGTNDWWDPLSNKMYLEREFFFKHYSEMQTKDQSENIGDNGSLCPVFGAYKEGSERQNNKNKRLPSLNFTAKKLILRGHRLCCIEQPTNLDRFSYKFKFPEGSSMNPKKCDIY